MQFNSYHCDNKMVSSIEKLPRELLHFVVQEVDDGDLKALRHTSRHFCDIATRRYFEYTCIPYEIVCATAWHDSSKKDRLAYFERLIAKYGHLIRYLSVDGVGNDDTTKPVFPFGVISFFDKMPNLHQIDFAGEFADSGYPDGLTDAQKLTEIIQRASLKACPEERCFKQLRDCKMFIRMKRKIANSFKVRLSLMGVADNPWALDSLAIVFIMDQLEELHLSYVQIVRKSLAMSAASEFRGKTSLKILDLKAEFDDLETLDDILQFPNTLTHLELSYFVRPDQNQSYLNLETDEDQAQKLRKALSRQNSSLEELQLYIGYQHEAEFPATDIGIDMSQFPRLRSYVGSYTDSSGKFNQFWQEREESFSGNDEDDDAVAELQEDLDEQLEAAQEEDDDDDYDDDDDVDDYDFDE